MVDSGRFNPARDEVEDASSAHVTENGEQPILIDNAAFPAILRQTTLFDLGQIDVRWDAELSTLWAFMTPSERPNSNLALVRDTATWLHESSRAFGDKAGLLKFMVLGSRYSGIFNLGGDLEMFAEYIERGDRDALLAYGVSCCQIVDRIWHSNNMNIINIGLAQGDALGGGLEALMCFDVIIAERQARFGLPEVLFGLFPGMGAYSILVRRVGPVVAKQMITEGRVYSADEMYEMGIVNLVVETGQGEAATIHWIKDHTAHHAGYVGINRAGRRVNPLTLQELTDIVETWTDTAMALSSRDLRMMRRLAAAQSRLR